jgi:hypothetical protein
MTNGDVRGVRLSSRVANNGISATGTWTPLYVYQGSSNLLTIPPIDIRCQRRRFAPISTRRPHLSLACDDSCGAPYLVTVRRMVAMRPSQRHRWQQPANLQPFDMPALLCIQPISPLRPRRGLSVALHVSCRPQESLLSPRNANVWVDPSKVLILKGDRSPTGFFLVI